ncbi:MAG: response regulator [Bacteroidales bacterium]|jgi:DNA-binding LytR/AlgR family response regulator
MAKAKILIVEDESIIAKDIQNSLLNLNYNVPDIVNTGEKAIMAVEEHKPDLVLMDIVLKGEMNGIEAAKKIKEEYNVPVVFLTANADDAIINKAKLAEPYGFIIKPFREKELQTTIEMILYKHEKVSEIKKERDFYNAIIENKDIKDSIYVRSDYRLNRIKFEDIYYIEALKDYVIINTTDNSYTTHTTMKEILGILPPKDFSRVHRSFIVRLDKIFSIKYPDLVIEDKKKVLPIGGLYKKELYNRLNFI